MLEQMLAHEGLLCGLKNQITYLAVLETHDLLDVVDLCIASNLGSAGVPHIQQLPPTWRYTESESCLCQ